MNSPQTGTFTAEEASQMMEELRDAGMLPATVDDVESLDEEFDRDSALDSAAALQMSLDQIPVGEEGVRMIVYRIPDSNSGVTEDTYLFETTPQEFNTPSGGLAKIRRAYGGGRFRVRVFRKKTIQGKNKQLFVRQTPYTTRVISIEEPRGGVQEEVSRDTSSNDSGALAQVVQMMMAEQQKTRDDLRLMMDGMANIVKESMSARKPEKSTKEMLEEMMLIKQFVTPPPVPVVQAPPQRDVVDEVKKMMEMMGMIRETVAEADPGDSDSAMIGLGKQLLGVVTSGQLGPLTQGGAPIPSAPVPQQPRPQPVIQRRPAAPTQEAVQPLPQPMQSPQQEQDMQAIIRAAIGQLITLAGNDADPYVYANVVLDQAGDDTVRGFLGAPDWWADLVKLHPGVVPHQAWFLELRDEVMRLLSETDDDTSPEQESAQGLETGVSVESDANDGNASGNS